MFGGATMCSKRWVMAMKYTKLSRCCVVTMRFYEVVRKLGACGAMLVPVVADIRVARCCCVVRSVTSQMTEVLFELTKFFGM